MKKEIKSPYDINFSGFIDREDRMRKVYRYSNFYDFYYRTNIYIHSIRIFYMIINSKEIILKTFPDIDLNKILVTSLIHDDSEILIGDFQAGDRKKMSKKQLKKQENIEEIAIKDLSKEFPKYIEG